MTITEAVFYGNTFEPKRDTKRLQGQSLRVYEALSSGKWLTLDQLAQMTGDPPQSVSARIRGLRHPENGAHLIERKYVERGLFRYRLVLSAQMQLL